MRAYTISEILSGHYPDPFWFNEIIAMTRKLPKPEPFIGIAFGGSVATGNHTRLSDIDGIGLYKSDQETEVQKRIREIVLLAKENHVPMNDFRFVPLSLAQSQQHTLTHSYKSHLLRCAEDAGDDQAIVALDCFIPHHLSAQSAAVEYLSRKRSKLRGLQYFAEAENTDEWRLLIEEVLSTPFYCAQRMLESTGRQVYPQNMSRIAAELESYTQHVAPGMRTTAALLDRILLIRFELVDDFELAIRGEMEPYHQSLMELASLTTEACQAVDQIGFHLDHLIRTGGRQPQLV